MANNSPSAKAPVTRQHSIECMPPVLQFTETPSNHLDTLTHRNKKEATDTSLLQQPLRSNSHLQLPPHAIVTRTSTLGFGTYGEVLEVKYQQSCYAAKKYNEQYVSPAKLFDAFESKVCKLNHPNIVPYFGVGKLSTESSKVILMERLESNFATFVENVNALQTRISVLCDIARGLEYAHSQNPAIIHCDLTSTNVLVTADGKAKIADFANSHMVSITTPELQSHVQDYMAPEAMEGTITTKVDVFSFGHLSLFAIIQHRPHPLQRARCKENGHTKALSEVERRQKYIDEMKEKLNEDVYPLIDLVETCLSDEPSERLTVRLILIVLACIYRMSK